MAFDRTILGGLPSCARAWMALACAALLASCESAADLNPTFPGGGLLATAVPVAPSRLARLDGMYDVEGDGPIAGRVAVHATPSAGTVSIFAQVASSYAILRAGCLDGGARVVLEGAWRHPRTLDAGLVRLFVDGASAAKTLCSPDEPEASLLETSLGGATGNGAKLPDEPLALGFVRPLVDPKDRFVVVAHHGACRTIDECGASENSLESIALVESFGASVVELDVRLTADGVPILYHDEEFTPRLSRGVYCHGPVAEFTLAHVRSLCRLTYGEPVPTLEEALATALGKTTLAGVWLDVKTPDTVGPALALAAKYNASAKKLAGRRFWATVGLGEPELLDAYLAAEKPAGTPCLVELEPDDVRRAGCQLWGPRWTRGPLAEEVAALQAEGRGVVYWTIDDPAFLDLFLTEGKPNGVLSDRPGLVFQRFQEIGVMPEGSVTP